LARRSSADCRSKKSADWRLLLVHLYRRPLPLRHAAGPHPRRGQLQRTAYLRFDLTPTSTQTDEIRQMFRDYLDARLVVYSDLDDPRPDRDGAPAGHCLRDARRSWV